MKKAAKLLCILAFLLVCALILAFFAPLTDAGGAVPELVWESAAVVDAAGAETPFDQLSAPPVLREGESYRFGVTLPERDEMLYLIVTGTVGESSLALDGEEIYAFRADEYVATGQLLLETGGGETLTMDVVPSGTTGVFPPMLQLTDDPTGQRGSIAYANLYAIPAGATALALALLCGLFLLGLANGRADWRLPLLIFAAAALTVAPLSQGFGLYFFSDRELLLLSWSGWDWLTVLALLAYLALHRSKKYWAIFGAMAAASLLLLTACWAVPALHGSYFAKYMSSLLQRFAEGMYSDLAYWVTRWLVLACTVLSAWELLSAFTSAQAEASALSLRNRLVMENYRSIEAKLREGAAKQHEFAHRLAVLDAYLREGDYAALANSLAEWRDEAAGGEGPRYTEHIAVNAMLQDASARAAGALIEFRASAQLPKELGIPDADICGLLMNMLDNALEGAQRTPQGRERYVRISLKAAGGFLAVSCANSFDGQVLETEGGLPASTKREPESHGFGLAQMRGIAEKYGSVLDLSWTETEFTVQTALKI